MTSARLLAAALIACACGTTAATAAAQPPFPNQYRGTVSGTFSGRDTSDGVSTTSASWTITGLRLRRGRVMKSDADWSANYVVTAGKLTYHQAEAGACSYAFDKTLPLRTAIDPLSAGFALSQSLFGNHPTTALGSMTFKDTFHASETCRPTDGGPPQVAQREIPLAELFDPQEHRVNLGRRFSGHATFHTSHQVSSLTTKWSWVLKPGR